MRPGQPANAIARARLTGCSRSRSASTTSLTKYTAAAATVNTTAATSAYPRPSSRPSEAAASGAAKTSRFLGHWRGREVCTTAPSHRTGRADCAITAEPPDSRSAARARVVTVRTQP